MSQAPSLRRATLAVTAAALLLTVAAAIPAAGQGGTWGAVYTEAAVTGAPDWVRPGTRIVQYVASASVPQSRYALVEDPNGNLENPRTGKRYRRTDETGEGVGGGSGDGWSVIDIISVTPEQVVGAVSLHVMDHVAGTISYLPIGGGPEPAGAMDGVWLHPRIIEGLVAQGQAPGAELLVGAYPLGGVTYDVAALVSASQDVSLDRATGLVVVASGNAAGAVSPVHLEGEDPPRGNTLRTYQQLAGVRDRTLAGLGAPVPGWLRPGTRLVYEGTYTALGQPVPSRTTFTAEAVGPDWARFHALNETSGMGLTVTNETWAVSGGTGPYWYDPAALATMRSGDILDQDPIVGTTVRVGDVGSGANGGAFVWIVTEGPGLATWFQYDVATGVPLGYSIAQASGTTTLWLASVS